MADVFISYAREDMQKAKLLADALAGDGLSVWWDHDLMGGDEFRKEIDETIAAANIVIVIWSENSVKSPFVKDEASRANERGVLLPVAVGEVEPPVGFGELQTIRFKRWAETTAEWETLVRTVHARLRQVGATRARPSAFSATQRQLAFFNRNLDVFLLTLFAQSLGCFLIFQPLHFLDIPQRSEVGFVLVTSVLLAGVHTSALIARRVGIVLRLVAFASGAVTGYFSYLFAGATRDQIIALGGEAMAPGGGVSLFNAFVFFIYVVVSGAIGLMSDR